MFEFSSPLLFSANEAYAATLLGRMLLVGIVDEHNDTVASQCYSYPEEEDVLERIGKDGYRFALLADLSLAQYCPQSLPISIQEDLEDELNSCSECFKHDFPEEKEATLDNSLHFVDYQTQWLSHCRYFYNVKVEKDFNTGVLSVTVWLNPNGLNRGTFSYGSTQFELPITDSMTENDIFYLVKDTVRKSLDAIWTW